MLPTDNFDKILPEKQQIVLNAALTCFGRSGYKRTAMSEIAIGAGISKASLFHYFNTKKELFIYLYRYACDEILAEMVAGTEDLIECVRLGAQIKIRVMKKHPGMYDFLLSLVTETDGALLEELKQINNGKVERGMALLFCNVDWSRFREGLDRTTAMNLLSWVSEGCIKKYSATKSWNELTAEIDRYMGIMKNVLYKEAYQ